MGKRRRRVASSDTESSADSGDSSADESESESDLSNSDSGSNSDDSSNSNSSGSSNDSDSASNSSDSDSDDASSDSSSGDDETERIIDVLGSSGLKKQAKKIVKAGTKSFSAARKLTEKKLTRLGISSSAAKIVVKVLNQAESTKGSKKEDVSSSSESSGEDEASAEEEEDEIINRILRSIDMTQYSKAFKKGKVDTLKKAYKFDTEKKLRRLGIENKDDRELIAKEFVKRRDNKTDSEEPEEIKIAKILKGIDMKRYIKNLQKGKVLNLDTAFKLNDKKLKMLGIASRYDRKKIIKALVKYKDGHAQEDVGYLLIKKLLSRAGMSKYYAAFKKKEIDSVAKAKALEHKELRDMGVHLYRERRDILDQFEKYNGEEVEDIKSEESDGHSSGGDNVIHSVLRAQLMARHIPDFDRANVVDLKQARLLTQTQLRSMGVALYLDREKLINAFKEYKQKNPAIMKILVDANLGRYASEFEKLIDIEEAKKLTHSDLRNMGISLYGQRDRLIKAFNSYEEKSSVSSKKSKSKDSKSSKGSKSSKDHTSSSGSELDEGDGELNAVEAVLAEQHMHQYIARFEGVTTIEQARALNHTQLRNRGLKLYGEREKLMKAFENYKPKKRR